MCTRGFWTTTQHGCPPAAYRNDASTSGGTVQAIVFALPAISMVNGAVGANRA